MTIKKAIKKIINVIKPQKGYQEMALSSRADILIGGGAAGTGKTFTLLLEALRNINTQGYGAVIFRRTGPMIRAEGGLWDASAKLYSHIDQAESKKSSMQWIFPKAKIKFSHLEYEKNIYDWQGSEIPFIGFDELTHFTKKMFFYMLSRNRSTCGVKPYIRATCNPDPDSWVAELIAWWIGEDGYPIAERQGVLRYFMVDNDNYIWGNSKKEVIEKGWHIIGPQVEKGGIKPDHFVKSITFIGGSIYDNQELLKSNPEYLGNLNAQSKEEKSRLLDGNWHIKQTEDDVYDYHKARDIFTNRYNEEVYQWSEKRITTDIAMKGSDKFVVFVWQGRMLIDCKIMDKSKGNEVIDAINEMAYKHGVSYSNILFDNDGVGQFVDGFIDGANEFNNGGVPINRENYKNLKTQCYFKSGESVGKGEYYILPHVAEMMYDSRKTIKERFLYERKAIKRAKPDHDGKLQVIPKQEMKPYINNESPDIMDAFAMNEWFYLVGESPEVYYS